MDSLPCCHAFLSYPHLSTAGDGFSWPVHCPARCAIRRIRVQWQTVPHVGPVTERYFITGANKKILLEHDEDYCLSWDGTRLPPDSGCMQMAADAADNDLSAAYYVDATHHMTNATAWMMSQDQVSFLDMRNGQCRVGPDPLGCRILMTRERVGVVIGRPHPAPHPVHR